MPVDRPAVRIVCVDVDGRILLMRWHDPSDGRTYWEPPGGGIDPGETPLEAARRELHEETGLDPAAVEDRWVDVPRDFHWLGTHFVKVEQFYLARFGTARPVAEPAGFSDEELSTYRGNAWLTRAEIAGLDLLDPPNFLETLLTFGVDLAG